MLKQSHKVKIPLHIISEKGNFDVIKYLTEECHWKYEEGKREEKKKKKKKKKKIFISLHKKKMYKKL